ncbi:hypothetical protein FKM82_017164 [Ascaphus truei]
MPRLCPLLLLVTVLVTFHMVTCLPLSLPYFSVHLLTGSHCLCPLLTLLDCPFSVLCIYLSVSITSAPCHHDCPFVTVCSLSIPCSVH